ncbi:MAG: hypothetical protein ABFS32_05775 [Bacteroidota bacterium]
MSIKINVENLPLSLRLLGIALFLLGMLDLYVSESYMLDIALLLIGLTLATTHQRLDINLNTKQYQSYYWILGLKFQNEKFEYQEINSIMCVQGKYNQEYGFYPRMKIKGTMFRGYIKLTDQESLFVGQNKKKEALMKKLEKLGQQMNITVEDWTEE